MPRHSRAEDRPTQLNRTIVVNERSPSLLWRQGIACMEHSSIAGVNSLSCLLKSFMFTRVWKSILFGVRASDPLTFIAWAVLLAGTSTPLCHAQMQTKSIRHLIDIAGPVRTVRIESRQLAVHDHRQWGVMVYTTIYDSVGRVLEQAEYLPGANPDVRSTSVYDPRGNEIEHVYYIHDELNHRTITKYDDNNRELEVVSFDGNGEETSRRIFRYARQGTQSWRELRPDGYMARRGLVRFDRRGNKIESVE